MSFEKTLPNGNGYWLVAVDENGAEREEAGALTSAEVVRAIAASPGCDVFVMSHGWKGDVPGAREQYERWFGRLVGLAPAGRPLVLVGFHWPSLPYGDEKLGNTFSLQLDAAGAFGVDATTDEWMTLTGAPEAVRGDVRAIIAFAEENTEPDALPADVADAFARIEAALGIEGRGSDAPPGQDREPAGADAVYRELRDEGSYGLFDGGGGPVIGLLRQLSFWKMKKRAHEVGKAGGARLLAAIAGAARAAGGRVHLFGHSFGCIVVSSMLLHAKRDEVPSVRSAALVQGALSTWAYCAKHPFLEGAGHFASIISDRRVEGPLVITKSMFDRAVRLLYPLGTRAAGLGSYGGAAPRPASAEPERPKYGGLGTYGALGVGAVEVAKLGAIGARHDLARGKLFNVDAANVIRQGGGASGAHSDLDHPELFQLVWEAASVG
jgi:hypothetical protein